MYRQIGEVQARALLDFRKLASAGARKGLGATSREIRARVFSVQLGRMECLLVGRARRTLAVRFGCRFRINFDSLVSFACHGSESPLTESRCVHPAWPKSYVLFPAPRFNDGDAAADARVADVNKRFFPIIQQQQRH